MKSKRGIDFKFDQIESYPTPCIARFLIAAAREEWWALEITGLNHGDSPLDGLASWWASARASQKKSLEVGLLHALKMYTRRGLRKEQLKISERLVASIAFFSRDFVTDSKKLITMMSFWLRSGIQPHGEFAALCLGAVADLDALTILELYWAEYPENVWLGQSVLLCRVRQIPFQSLSIDPLLFEGLLGDDRALLALKYCITNMFDLDSEKAIRYLAELVGDLSPRVRIKIAEIVKENFGPTHDLPLALSIP